MKLDELQSVQSRERQTDQLQQLRATFYEEAGTFIGQLREERDRAAERADDPFDSPEVNRLTNDIKTAEQTVEAIYERRVGKIVKMASLAAADMPTEENGLTQEERQLFETMVTAIQENRGHVLDVIAGESHSGSVGDAPSSDGVTADSPDSDTEPITTPSAADSEPTATEANSDAETTVNAADIMGGGDGPGPLESTADSPAPEETPTADGGVAEPTDRPADEAAVAVDEAPTPAETPETDVDGAAVDRKTVRITDDVGEIFGVDQREYDLSTDDVVTLPADNADPLVERDAAEPLE